MSPLRRAAVAESASRKQRGKNSSYLRLAVNRELLDLARQMQQPRLERCTSLLCSEDIAPEVTKGHQRSLEVTEGRMYDSGRGRSRGSSGQL